MGLGATDPPPPHPSPSIKQVFFCSADSCTCPGTLFDASGTELVGGLTIADVFTAGGTAFVAGTAVAAWQAAKSVNKIMARILSRGYPYSNEFASIPKAWTRALGKK